jgi:probable F420-dependent oxidoreductase
VTSRIRIHFAALVVPYLGPIQTARALASIDQLSGGRVGVTIGAGWMKEEFDALGVAFEHRGAITDEYITVMRGLWSGEEYSHSGAFVSLSPATLSPTCAQRPHVPIWVGGSGRAAKRRVAEYGAGWTPLYGSLAELAGEIAEIRELVAARGRDPGSLGFGFHMAYGERDLQHDAAAAKASEPDEGLWGRTSAEAIDVLKRAEEAGLTNMEITSGWTSTGHLIEILHNFHEEVMPSFAA